MAGPDARLLAAYTGAHYQIQAPRPFTLRVDESSEALLAVHRQFRVGRSAVISAFNPGSETRDAQINACAHRQLLDTVTERGWFHILALNRDPGGQWPDEPALLVLGADEAAARELGRRFGQAAVLVNGADVIPRLLWCQDR